MIIKTLTVFSYVLIVLILNACNNPPAKNYADFMTEKNIQLDEHNIPAVLGQPIDMLVVNDLIIVLDSKTDKFFHVFLKDNYNYIGSFIRKGRGPCEETYIRPFFKVHTIDKFYYESDDDLKMAKIKMDNDSLNIIIHDRYNLPTSILTDNDFFLVDEFIFSSMSQRAASKDYFVLNNETGELSEWGESIPLSGQKVNADLIPWINQKVTTVNSNDDLIASVFNLLPILRIYSLENEKLMIELQMSDASNNREIILADQLLKRSKEVINYYHRIKSTDNYIYALYGGFSVAGYFKEGETPHLFDWSREIHIWKWDGTPVMKLKLDRPVFSFEITSDNKKVIATSVVDVDKLFEAEIPWDL